MKRRARKVFISMVIPALAGSVIATGGVAHAEAPQSVFATAEAHGLRTQYTFDNFAVVSSIIDGGGPVAESLVSSADERKAFAALPYPGANAISAPGVIGFAAGHQIPASYPFYANADYPVSPSTEVKDPSGSYALAAKADEHKASGSAILIAGSGGSRSTTESLFGDDGAVRAVAQTVSSAVSVGNGALTIASVTARSESILKPGETAPSAHTSLAIQGASVGGQAVTIDADGVHLAGAGTPGLPSSTPPDAVLEQAGITVQILRGTTAGGGAATSDILVVTDRHEPPGGGKGTFVWALGGARTQIFVAPDGVAPAPAPAGSGGSPAPGETQTAVASQLEEVPRPAAAVHPVMRSASMPALSSASAAATTIVDSAPNLVLRRASQVVKAGETPKGSVAAPFAVLAVGGLVLLVCTRLRRRGSDAS